uniref:Large ribosomal subunit protein uL24c n=1 Tax=Dasya binghamiae TaxID=1896963 RepID=A0A1C8XS17_9FLOR|nr:50S ribosomal protein L24 [Dasya binghamiae]AOH77290.1 50S ribosomal protein L24 [Dasya binghamiae]
MTKKKTRFKIGDNVTIISGKHKGKNGEIIKIILKKDGLIIKNINFKVKHIKPKQTEEKGEIKQIEAYIHKSNVKKYITN